MPLHHPKRMPKRKANPMVRPTKKVKVQEEDTPADDRGISGGGEGRIIKTRRELAQDVKMRNAKIREAAMDRGGDDEWATQIQEYQATCLNLKHYTQYIDAAISASRECDALLRIEEGLMGDTCESAPRSHRRLTSTRVDAISPTPISTIQPCPVCPRLADDTRVMVDKRVLLELQKHLIIWRTQSTRVVDKVKSAESHHQSFMTDMIVSAESVETMHTTLMQEIVKLRRALARRVQRVPGVLIPRNAIENGWTIPREQAVVHDPILRTPFTGRVVEETRYNPSTPDTGVVQTPLYPVKSKAKNAAEKKKVPANVLS